VLAGLFVAVWWAWWGDTWFSAGFDAGDRILRVGS
jgi:low temperature requirement protein LtrA